MTAEMAATAVEFSALRGCVSMRMFVVFEKGERLRHIGHLDIMRTMQRALRRSGLPVSYSKGFNPHILLGFASALSVGAVGENELMEITLDSGKGYAEFLEYMDSLGSQYTARYYYNFQY